MGDTACKLKIILDGGNAARLYQSLADAATQVDAELFTDEDSYPLIKKLIAAEKAATECQDLLLNIVGYTGPRPQFFSKGSE